MLIPQLAVHQWNRCRRRITPCSYFHKAAFLARRVLLCGDGDLSYAASIAKQLKQQGSHLTATVLESQEEHNRVYRNSRDNVREILHFGREVHFGIDSTQLETYNLDGPVDHIQWNFPHWPGKNNNRYNRKLLSDFFASSRKILRNDGHVHVALMAHQGGAFSSTLRDWKQSWMATRLAANHDLILTSVEPFEPTYQLSAYKREDRRFRLGGEPQLYTFAAPDTPDCRAKRFVQLFCHFNVYLHQDEELNDPQCRLERHVQDRLPEGWLGQVEFVRVMDGYSGTLAVYKICFFGETRPILQPEADHYRTIVQNAMLSDNLPLAVRRKWVISNTYPRSMLDGILQADRMRTLDSS